MCDGIPMGTEWELIPNLLLKDATFGIYGPIGIIKNHNVIITLNGRCSVTIMSKPGSRVSVVVGTPVPVLFAGVRIAFKQRLQFP